MRGMPPGVDSSGSTKAQMRHGHAFLTDAKKNPSRAPLSILRGEVDDRTSSG